MKYTLTALLLFFSITALHAGDRQLMPYPENEKIFIYPNKGQSDEQVQDDKFQCYQEAMKLTGFDPSSIPQGESAPPGISDVEPPKTPAGFGGNTGTPDKGYLAGEAKKEWKTDEINKYEAGKANYNKTYKTCLENRGYTVN